MDKYVKIFNVCVSMCFALSTLYSCSDDDDERNMVLLSQKGTVLGPTSCNTESNGNAFMIDVDNFNPLGSDAGDFIITATLSDEFKSNGLRIEFDMENSREGITICTTDFFPEQFYKVINVINIPEEN